MNVNGLTYRLPVLGKILFSLDFLKCEKSRWRNGLKLVKLEEPDVVLQYWIQNNYGNRKVKHGNLKNGNGIIIEWLAFEPSFISWTAKSIWNFAKQTIRLTYKNEKNDTIGEETRIIATHSGMRLFSADGGSISIGALMMSIHNANY